MTTTNLDLSAVLKKRATEQSIRNLFEAPHFDICDFREVASLLGVHPSNEITNQLRQFHCMHYSDMDEDLLLAIQAGVVEALRPRNVAQIDNIVTAILGEAALEEVALPAIVEANS